jgi:nucleoside triphosphatase
MAKQEFPQIAVGALIVNSEGRILLAKSHKWNNKYTVPGGKVELGETMEEALKREVKEETGLDISDLRLLLVQEMVFDKEFWKRKHYILVDFLCRTDGTKVKLNDEFQDYVWERPNKALNLDVEPYTKPLIEQFNKVSKRK